MHKPNLAGATALVAAPVLAITGIAVLLAGLAGACAGLMAGQTRLARTDEAMVRSQLAEPVPGDATPIVPEPHLQAHRRSH